MLNFLDPLRDFNFASLCLRMVLALVCGGLIGLEREFKRRPAGFRTHILICLGAAVATLTSQYLVLEMAYPTDVARLAAQVIAGIGFIGAGTIIVTRRQRVKGLTTAAGLWVCAIVGLAIGGGFYEGAVLTTALVLIAELLFSRLEFHMLRSSPEINLYVEYSDRSCLEAILKLLRRKNAGIQNLELTRSPGEGASSVILSLRLSRKLTADSLNAELHRIDGVLLVEEI